MKHAFEFDPSTRFLCSMSPDDGGSAGSAPSEGGGGGPGAGGGSSVATPGPGPAADGGGGSGPPATPAESAPSATPGEAPSDPGWGNLGSFDDLDFIPVDPAPIPAEAPAAVVPPVVAPPVPPAQMTPPPATPPQAAPAPPAAGGDSRPLTAAEPWRIAEGLEANRDAVIAHLAGSKFALSEDDVKDLDTDVTVAVPKLLSRVFLESQVAMQKFLAQAVPGMIKQYNSVTGANETAEKKFFDTHTALDRNNPQHRQTVVRLATVYRQANPDIPLQQLIAEVGPMAMAALQIPAGTPRPGAPPVRRPVPSFTPAVNGGGGPQIAPEPVNEWSGLGQDYD